MLVYDLIFNCMYCAMIKMLRIMHVKITLISIRIILDNKFVNILPTINIVFLNIVIMQQQLGSDTHN